MLPPGLSQHADVLIRLLKTPDMDSLPPAQRSIINALGKRGDLRGRQLDAALPKVNWRGSLAPLIRQGVLESRPVLPPPSVRPRFTRTAQYLSTAWKEGDANLLGTPSLPASRRRRAVMEFLQEKAIPVNVSWVYAETGATSADLNHLAEKGLILLGETELWRDPLAGLQPVLTTPPVLTAEQESAWTKIIEVINLSTDKTPILVEGVTGSGKTELYLRAAAEVLAAGRGVIVLVPEIALTPQTTRRFFARFPGKVALIHSQLSPGERYDTWRRVRDGQLPIVIGARSALFAPLPNLGLIVIDECHDPSYHQDDLPPRYHAVDAAIELARLTHSTLLLGSATPGVELKYHASREKWQHLELTRRVNDLHSPTGSPSLPSIEVVDMRQELQSGNRSALSRKLHDELATVLSRKEQAILFLNRRGSASHVFCRACGHILRCPRCETQLTYHADEAALTCHTCNYKRQMPQKCPQCGSKQIRQFGMGTESLEKLVGEQFPTARVLRWDADTTRFKGAHDLILDHFTQQRADILIGTQMVAKGLDLPLVTLVGMVLVDVSLGLPDFRSSERTYQLLTQVAGRAGRSERGGKAILQTFQPEHYAIQAAAGYDARGFEKTELKYREAMGYPPYSRLVKVELRHTDPLRVQTAAQAAGEELQNRIKSSGDRNTTVIGPVPCFYQKRAGVYRWQLLLRGPDPLPLLRDRPLNLPGSAGLSVEVTVDPTQLL